MTQKYYKISMSCFKDEFDEDGYDSSGWETDSFFSEYYITDDQNKIVDRVDELNKKTRDNVLENHIRACSDKIIRLERKNEEIEKILNATAELSPLVNSLYSDMTNKSKSNKNEIERLKWSIEKYQENPLHDKNTSNPLIKFDYYYEEIMFVVL